MWWRGVVGLREGGWTCSYTYKAIYMGTSSGIYEGALGCCEVYKGLHMGTFLMFLDLALCISFISSFSIL